MAYDAKRQRVVLFGGSRQGYSGTELGDTWEWDGASWTPCKTAHSPSARRGHALAYDSARSRVVLFGGIAPTGELDDTWEWDGTDWLAIATKPTPPRRSGHALSYDVQRARTVLFGGPAGAWPGGNSETWEWDGTSWSKAKLTSPPPPPREATLLAYDAARRQTVLFGGMGSNAPLSDTWIYGLRGPDVAPAAIDLLGAPCHGTVGAPEIAGSLPFLGSRLVVDLMRARPSAPCAFACSGTWSPVAYGACTFYLGAPLLALPTVTDAGGFASHRIDVPAEAALRNARVFAQALVIDPLGGFGGFAMTGALGITLGD